MKNLKFKVQVNHEQSISIQQAVFKKGGSWSSGTTVVICRFYPFLVLKKGCLTTCKDEDDFYENHGDVKQVFAREALALINGCKAIKPVFVVDIREGEIAVRKNTPVRPAVLDKDTPGLVCIWTLGETHKYSPYSGITLSYRNQHRPGILDEAHTQCNELNQKGEDE